MSWSTAPASQFHAHAARWQALHAAGAASPLLALEFVTSLLATFGTGKELLAWHSTGGETDAMTILTPARFGIWNTFQPSQAPVGIWLQRGTDAPTTLLPGLLQALPFPALALGLTQCDPMLTARPPASAQAGATRVLDYIDTARITITGSFDAYWAARGKNLRNNLKKQRRGLADDGVATRLEVIRAPGQMAQAIADYGRLESTGWKGTEGTAVDGSNEQGRFYQVLLEAFAARDAACVYRYWIGDKVAAMDLCVEGGGCIVVLKTTYDEQLSKQLSPALLMREEAVRQLFGASRFERIEFYGRVMEWHMKWTDEVRTMFHLNLYRSPTLAALHRWAIKLHRARRLPQGPGLSK